MLRRANKGTALRRARVSQRWAKFQKRTLAPRLGGCTGNLASRGKVYQQYTKAVQPVMSCYPVRQLSFRRSIPGLGFVGFVAGACGLVGFKGAGTAANRGSKYTLNP